MPRRPAKTAAAAAEPAEMLPIQRAAGEPADTSAAPEPAAAPEAASPGTAAPRKAATRKARRRKPAEVPPHLRDTDATSMLQVRVRKGVHFQFKAETAWHGTDMSTAVLQMVDVFIHNSDAITALATAAQAAGMSLGEYLQEALDDAVTAGKG